MVPAMLQRVEKWADKEEWKFLSDNVVLEGPIQPRLRPGVAVAILRHCLAALGEMHRHGIVHGDIKPWNIMLTIYGNAKLVDIGSAFAWKEKRLPTHWTPLYLAPEVTEGKPYTPRSDLASLGYVLIELLAGRPLFTHLKNLHEVLQAKKELPERLRDKNDDLLPSGVREDPRPVELCCRLIHPDPEKRFQDAAEADVESECSAFHYLKELARDDIALAWEVDIRRWLACLA
jgi:serine/threonine-protein kinase